MYKVPFKPIFEMFLLSQKRKQILASFFIFFEVYWHIAKLEYDYKLHQLDIVHWNHQDYSSFQSRTIDVTEIQLCVEKVNTSPAKLFVFMLD